jgi:hypothetical protein
MRDRRVTEPILERSVSKSSASPSANIPDLGPRRPWRTTRPQLSCVPERLGCAQTRKRRGSQCRRPRQGSIARQVALETDGHSGSDRASALPPSAGSLLRDSLDIVGAVRAQGIEEAMVLGSPRTLTAVLKSNPIFQGTTFQEELNHTSAPVSTGIAYLKSTRKRSSHRQITRAVRDHTRTSIALCPLCGLLMDAAVVAACVDQIASRSRRTSNRSPTPDRSERAVRSASPSSASAGAV